MKIIIILLFTATTCCFGQSSSMKNVGDDVIRDLNRRTDKLIRQSDCFEREGEYKYLHIIYCNGAGSVDYARNDTFLECVEPQFRTSNFLFLFKRKEFSALTYILSVKGDLLAKCDGRYVYCSEIYGKEGVEEVNKLLSYNPDYVIMLWNYNSDDYYIVDDADKVVRIQI